MTSNPYGNPILPPEGRSDLKALHAIAQEIADPGETGSTTALIALWLEARETRYSIERITFLLDLIAPG